MKRISILLLSLLIISFSIFFLSNTQNIKNIFVYPSVSKPTSMSSFNFKKYDFLGSSIILPDEFQLFDRKENKISFITNDGGIGCIIQKSNIDSISKKSLSNRINRYATDYELYQNALETKSNIVLAIWKYLLLKGWDSLSIQYLDLKNSRCILFVGVHKVKNQYRKSFLYELFFEKYRLTIYFRVKPGHSFNKNQFYYYLNKM